MTEGGSPGVLLDRDGVINELVLDPRLGTGESPYAPEDVRLKTGVIGALEQLDSLGFVIAVVSNQPAAAKGTVPAGCRTALITDPTSAHRRTGQIEPDITTPDLQAVAQALARERR